MTWLILILISVFFASLAIIVQRILLKDDKSDPIAYSIFFQLLTGIIIGIFTVLSHQMIFPDFRKVAFNLILMVLIYGGGNIFSFKALKLVEASEFTILFASRALVSILASSIFINEGFSLKQFFGAGLILISVILVTYKKTRLQLKKGEILALLAAVMFGLSTTNDRILLKSFSVYPYVTIAFILPAFFTAVVYPKKILKIKLFFEKGRLFKYLLMCSLYVISSLTFFTGLQLANNSSQVAAINQVQIILIVILGMIFLKERDFLKRKITGAVLSLIGVILVK